MIKKMLKNNRGIVVADALIAVLILTIFLSIISTLTYSVYIAASFTKRNSTALNYGIDIIEYIDRTDYDKVTEDKLENYINNELDDNISTETSAENTPYKAILNVENHYNESAGELGNQDLIKIITLQIQYKLGDSEKEVTFERVKQK